ncbi:MAG: peptidylprolyl isomerase [Terracidiphilus sp.]|jgi:peptidyl-prolyl cis-trans isomerase D
MIRFLQSDNRITKALFVVVIGSASVAMVVYLIPGLTGAGAAAPDTYAVVYPHWYSKMLSSGDTITETRVQQMAENELRQRAPQYASDPRALQFFEPQVGQQLVQEQVMLQEAHKLGIYATDNDVRQYLRTGPTGQVLYPDGKFIGEQAYRQLIDERLHTSVDEFENQIKDQIALHRLQAFITAGVTVGDQEVRETYRRANIKVKFDYAVISADDLRKAMNPTDSDLEAFFKQNAARYAQAVPEARKITYFAFTEDQIPGGVPQPTQQQIQQYYTDHVSDYSVPDQARSRHILIMVPQGADAKTDAAAKAKAEGILKQLQAGGSWTDLAKKYSEDPGSKDEGGELGFAQHGKMVPEFDKAIFTQKIGDIAIVKSSFGYHIIQVEERQSAHTKPLSEVQATIVAALSREDAARAESRYAQLLTSEAVKNGLEKAAAAHHLEVVTSQPVGHGGVIAALPDSSQLLAKAFTAKQGDPPQSAPTGEGYAVFQVTGVVPAHAPSFADWKTHVLDDYRDEQLPALLSQKTKDLAEKAKSMNDLAKAAKAVGATVKTSDLVSANGQVPDFGEVGQVAPQLFEMSVGSISGPINAGRTGVVVKILDKQEPSADEIAKNLDQTRDELLQEKRNEAFQVFLSGVWNDYKKHKLITFNAKTQQTPGM